ncbi:hypothetical protein BGZ63DRAFT_428750 [Mariannaea sp. PMI_226]|nr:hypothetical protein BGZ63DRAFT_428750 [Mariannaea sp. PMI_226]
MSGFPVSDGRQAPVPAPPGYVVNFDHPQQQKALDFYLVFGFGGALSLMALSLRFYTKIFLSKGLQIDDGLMFLAWMCSVVIQAALTYSISQGGMCAHIWEIPIPVFDQYSIITYVTAPLYQVCNNFAKLSLLYIYLQLSPQKWFKLAVWTVMAIITVYTALIVLLFFFHCHPIRKAYDLTIQTGSCLDIGAIYIVTAVSNILTDLMLFSLPIPMIINLYTSRGNKVGIIIMFGIGSMTVATSVVRLAYLPPVLKTRDPSWDSASSALWTFIEANLMIICGSVPTLRRFFKHIAPKLMGSTSNPSYASDYHAQRSAEVRKMQRNKYENFTDDASNEMEVFSSHSDRVGTRALGAVSGDANADNHSKKAILQSKTFTIQYT